MTDIKKRLIDAHVNLTLATSINDINIEDIRKLLYELIYDNLILNKEKFKKYLSVNREHDDNDLLNIKCVLGLETKTLVDPKILCQLGFFSPEQQEYEFKDLEEQTREKLCSSLEERCRKEE